MISKESSDFYNKLDLWNRVIYDCGSMFFSFSSWNIYSEGKKVAIQDVLGHMHLELEDHNEQASWIERVMIAVVLLGFAGTHTEECQQISIKYLNKLLAKENRPPDALEQISQWPSLNALLRIVEIPQ